MVSVVEHERIRARLQAEIEALRAENTQLVHNYREAQTSSQRFRRVFRRLRRHPRFALAACAGCRRVIYRRYTDVGAPNTRFCAVCGADMQARARAVWQSIAAVHVSPLPSPDNTQTEEDL
jgi:hypothetical protein